VIIVSAIKDIFEDLKRHKSDDFENNRELMRVDPLLNRNTKERWMNIKVGQVVRVSQNHYFPADILLIKSANPNGIAYVETKNLDGETNLKHKEAPKELQQSLSTIDALSGLRGRVVCEPPNDFLYKFEGTLMMGDSRFTLNHNQLLLRGSSLRNTDWIYGLVVYTGHDSKVMMNSSRPRTKFSNIELQTNKQIILVFIMQVAICLVGAFLSLKWDMH